MNKLSWMIYLADVSGSLAAALAMVGLASFGGCLIGVGYGGTLKERERKDSVEWVTGHSLQTFWLKLLWVPLTCFMVAVFIPSRDTVYAIAASEIAVELETKTAIGSKALRAVEAWLDKQIATDIEEKAR